MIVSVIAGSQGLGSGIIVVKPRPSSFHTTLPPLPSSSKLDDNRQRQLAGRSKPFQRYSLRPADHARAKSVALGP